MVVSDQRMLIFSPVPQLIEAGSEVQTKPNALMLTGDVVERAACAAGGGSTQPEIGQQGLAPADIAAIEADLSAEPPQKFQIVRAVRVFSATAEFVELEIKNVRLGTKRVALPPELLGVRNEGLKDRIYGGVQPPTEVSGPFTLEIEQEDGTCKEVKIDQRWLSEQRTEIERRYTFVVPNHGRVVLMREKDQLEAAMGRFQRNSERFRQAVLDAFKSSRENFKESLLEEYLPGWLEKPPLRVTRWHPHPSPEQIRMRLDELLQEVIDRGFTAEPMQYRLMYKGITWASVNDDEFVDSLKGAMRKRGVPREDLDKLFSQFDAARGARI